MADAGLLSGLLVLAGALLGLALGMLVHRLLRLAAPAADRTASSLDDAVLHAIEPGLPIALMALGLWLGVSTPVTVVPTLVVRVAFAVAIALGVFGFANILVKFLRITITRRVESRPNTRVLSTLAPAIGFAVYTVSGLVVLGTLGIQITPILASLGIGGLAVAWALQDTLSNIFAGWWIRASREVRPGHYVRMDDKKLEGFVNGIGWRTTRIRTLGNQTIIVPNGVLGQAVVTNFSIPSTRTPASVTVDVPLDQDPESILRILASAAMATVPLNRGILSDPPPGVQLIGFTDYSLRYSVAVHVSEYAQAAGAQDLLRRRIAARLRQEGIRLAVPTRETRAAPEADAAPRAKRPARPRSGGARRGSRAKEPDASTGAASGAELAATHPATQPPGSSDAGGPRTGPP